MTDHPNDHILSSMISLKETFLMKLPSYSEKYVLRENQLRMSERVWLSLHNKQSILIEAQTGVGKSNGYLVPALLDIDKESKPVIISTATKVLQDQLVRLLPDLLSAMDKKDVLFSVLKGKSNYLCPYKYEKARAKGDLPQYIYAKCKSAKEVDDLQLVGNAQDHIYKINADDDCTGRKCPLYQKCPLMQARARAKKSNIIITNHHLVMYDRKFPDTKILPDYDSIVFDEAHNLPSIISSVYTRSISESRVNKLVKDAIDLLPSSQTYLISLLEDLKDLSDIFFKSIMPGPGVSDKNSFLVDKNIFNFDAANNIAKICKEIISDNKGLPNRIIKIFVDDNEEMSSGEDIALATRITEKIDSLATDIKFIAKMHVHFAAWAERRVKRGRKLEQYTIISYTPLDIGPVFQQQFVKRETSAILVSATLGIGGKANYFKKLLGFDRSEKDIDFITYDSPFDYDTNTRVYLPDIQLANNDPNFSSEMQYQVKDIVEMLNGRTLVLCTSIRSMNSLHEYISSVSSHQCLKQGDMSTGDLIKEFKRDKSSILFATKSFWEGVDVPGEALSCVIIDKIPFPNQGDPIVTATGKYFESKYLNPFKMYSIPEAVMLFKQGVGRLIRSEEDKGIIAILDPRVVNSSYADSFLSALPTQNIIRDKKELISWLEKEEI